MSRQNPTGSHPSQDTNSSTDTLVERRRTVRPDPYDTLVEAPDDIIGLISYSLYREKKKIIKDDPHKRHTFDLIVPDIKDELREQAFTWFSDFSNGIEKQHSRIYLDQTRRYMDARLGELTEISKSFPWKKAIICNIISTFAFALIILSLVGAERFIQHMQPLDVKTKFETEIDQISPSNNAY